jgi:hypothetical protein
LHSSSEIASDVSGLFYLFENCRSSLRPRPVTVSRRTLKGYLARETGRSEFKPGVNPGLLYMVMLDKGIHHVITNKMRYAFE